MRPSADATFMAMARNLARRSTCARASVGALVVSSDGLQILGIGYNGAPRGVEHCTANQPAIPGGCGCIHAELNAIIKAPGTIPGLTLYTTTAPCLACASFILNTGIATVCYATSYRTSAGLDLLEARGIVTKYVAANL